MLSLVPSDYTPLQCGYNGEAADGCTPLAARFPPAKKGQSELYTKHQQLAIIAAVILMVYLSILWPLSAGAQSMPPPCVVGSGGEVLCNHVWLPMVRK